MTMQTTYQRNNTITTHAQEIVTIILSTRLFSCKITNIDLWADIESKPISPITQAKSTEQRDFTNITLEIYIRQNGVIFDLDKISAAGSK